MKKRKHIINYLMMIVMCAIIVFEGSTKVFATDVTNTETSNILRPSEAGKLSVEGTHIIDQSGEIVALQGVSLHGLTWYPQYVNSELFGEVSDWGANLIRLPAYSAEYVKGEQKQTLELIKKGIDYAVEHDMYVLVDWHILDDNDPNTNLSEAIEFWKTIAKEYSDVPNVLYEICNEPNGDTTWDDVVEYANCVIPVIKSYNKDALIIVGTPDYDRDVESALANPITGYSNIMYTFHFYSASHKEDMRDRLKNVVSQGLPVFVTECGLSESSGDGDIDLEESAKWYTYLKENNIAYAIWSLSNKEETSAMIRASVLHTGKVDDSELTMCGLYVKALMNGNILTHIDSKGNESFYERLFMYSKNHWIQTWGVIVCVITITVILYILVASSLKKIRKKPLNYNDYQRQYYKQYGQEYTTHAASDNRLKRRKLSKVLLTVSSILSLVYLCWRVLFSIPVYYGVIAIAANLLLLVAEIVGFIESQIHYHALLQLKDYPLPEAKDEEFPDVDIFIATYNEPEELLRKTIIGCKHIKYPDLNKVHIYLCDDNRRPGMRALAEELGINYFDRPDNKGAKAGNLNHALELTTSPYVVTLDADMIPMEDFLIATIPYYIDAKKKDIPLGFIQTPQCFYTYDVFQHNLYAENNIPNEQDFFYRTIEPSKTSTNSVIYGGSNTILSREALNSIGGFYTESITEDFATGMLIESHGYVSLGLPVPHASGMAPSSFEEHIQQRVRWGRGVIVTAKKLKFMRNKDMTMEQKLSYLSAVTYWLFPLFNMIYMLSPLVYCILGVAVFRCTLVELLLFWLPMFVVQNICLHIVSSGSMSVKWSNMQEMSVMPFLFVPILKELVGISLTTFKVTDKSNRKVERSRNVKALIPFIVLSLLNLIGVIRVLILFVRYHEIGLIVLLYWMVRNLYFLVMGIFMVDGRDRAAETVIVKAAEKIEAVTEDGRCLDGITTSLTEHNVKIFADEKDAFYLGERLALTIHFQSATLEVNGVVVEKKNSRFDKVPSVYTVEILDFRNNEDEYINALFNRIPTMPQSLTKDFGIFRYFFRNLGKRLGSW